MAIQKGQNRMVSRLPSRFGCPHSLLSRYILGLMGVWRGIRLRKRLSIRQRGVTGGVAKIGFKRLICRVKKYENGSCSCL